MAMGLNKGEGLTCDMNITPMIDVLLVLIIIFMMIQPRERGLEAEVPQPSTKNEPAPASPKTIVLEIVAGPNNQTQLRINGTAVPSEQLETRLRDIFKSRQEKILFLKGCDADFLRDCERDRYHAVCRRRHPRGTDYSRPAERGLILHQ